ncbi:MAG: MerR family transcriptional regulator [Myxococcota bacterium]|nr:MerR family transcriptional regulator [Myxococcota bacterium]
MIDAEETDDGRIKIGALMEATGVTRATIHHYLKEGLLPEPMKTSRNMALYSRDCIDRVLLIKGLQKHSRRSLAEVKELLSDTSDSEGIQRMQELLNVEATRVQVSPLNPERPREALSITQLAERTGLSMDELRNIESLGLMSSENSRGRRLFNPNDVDVAVALSELAEVGFDSEAGFVAEDALIYLHSLRDLLYKEVAIFLERVPDEGDPQEALTLARHGIERVTPLILALRRKLIADFIEAAPLPGSNKGSS